jgi:integrase
LLAGGQGDDLVHLLVDPAGLVDQGQGVVEALQPLGHGREDGERRSPGRHGHRVVIQLHPRLQLGVELQVAWRKRQTAERLAWGPAWTDAGLVFTREDGRPLHPQKITRAFPRHVLAAGLPMIRLHDLRHTHATLALAAGVHPKIVQERLGHANIAITLDTYGHAVPALRNRPPRPVARLVFGR